MVWRFFGKLARSTPKWWPVRAFAVRSPALRTHTETCGLRYVYSVFAPLLDSPFDLAKGTKYHVRISCTKQLSICGYTAPARRASSDKPEVVPLANALSNRKAVELPTQKSHTPSAIGMQTIASAERQRHKTSRADHVVTALRETA